MVRFESPALLLSFLVLIPVLALARTSRLRTDARRARATLILRTILCAALCLALAGPVLRLPSRRLTVLYALDVSRSMGPEARAEASRLLAEGLASAGPRDESGVLLFGGDALVEEPPRRGLRPSALSGRPDPDATSLAAAVRLAEGIFPPDGGRRLVLLTDGRENRDRVEDETIPGRFPSGQGPGPLEPFDLAVRRIESARSELEALVESVEAPGRVTKGQPHEVRVTCSSHAGQEAVLHLFRNDTPAGSFRVTLPAGEPRTFRFPFRAEEAGAVIYRAQLDAPRDGVPENNRGAAVTRIEGRGKVLLLDRRPDGLRSLREAARAAGIDVETGGADAIPADLGAAAAYDLIVIGDLSANLFPGEAIETLESYVRDLGGGLLMLGGPDGFGPGGWLGTPVERALPVDSTVANRRHLPTTSIVIALDKSGSMAAEPGQGAASKIELAKEAAAGVAEMLGPGDALGVVAFDDAAKWVAPLREGAEPSSVVRSIGTLRAGGGTDPYPALVEAEKALAVSRARVRHVLLMTDGQIPERDYRTIAERMAGTGITVSTVAVGSDADRTALEKIAGWGGGRFTFTEDVRTIPRIFTREAFTVARSYLVEEPTSVRVVTEHPVLEGVPFASAPALLGYVACSRKPEAELLLQSPRGDPVLVVWRFGLGKSAAFTSDAGDRWGGGWLGWEGYAPFWTQLLRWLLRSPESGELQAVVREDAGGLRFVVDAYDPRGEFREGAELEAIVVSPHGDRNVIPLAQTGPGRYSGLWQGAKEGVYLGAVVRKEAGRIADGALVGAVVPYSPEFRITGGDEAGVERLLASGRAWAVKEPRDLYRRDGTSRPAESPLRTLLVSSAALLLLSEVAVRRLPHPSQWRLGDFLKARVRAPARIAAPGERFRRLRESRDRAILGRRAGSRSSNEPGEVSTAPPASRGAAFLPTASQHRGPTGIEPESDRPGPSGGAESGDGVGRLAAARRRARTPPGGGSE